MFVRIRCKGIPIHIRLKGDNTALVFAGNVFAEPVAPRRNQFKAVDTNRGIIEPGWIDGLRGEFQTDSRRKIRPFIVNQCTLSAESPYDLNDRMV